MTRNARGPRVLVLLTVAIVACGVGSRTDVPSSILEENGTTVRLVLVDESAAKAIVADAVEIRESRPCRQAPCQESLLWSQRPNRKGAVEVPRRVITSTAMVSTTRHVAREIVDSWWSNDRTAWTLEVIPTPATRCENADRSWTMLVAADGRSAEALQADGRVARFGMMHCSNELLAGAFRRCGTPDIADAGYFATFSTATDGSVVVRLAAESRAGPRDLALLSCDALSR